MTRLFFVSRYKDNNAKAQNQPPERKNFQDTHISLPRHPKARKHKKEAAFPLTPPEMRPSPSIRK